MINIDGNGKNIINDFYTEIRYNSQEEIDEEKLNEIRTGARIFVATRPSISTVSEKVFSAVDKLRISKAGKLCFGHNYNSIQLNTVNEQMAFISFVADDQFGLLKEWEYYFKIIYSKTKNLRESYKKSNELFAESHKGDSFDLLPIVKCERCLKPILELAKTQENIQKK